MAREFFVAAVAQGAALHLPVVAHAGRAAHRPLRHGVRLDGREAAAPPPGWAGSWRRASSTASWSRSAASCSAPADEEPGVETYSAVWGRPRAVAAFLSALTLAAACATLVEPPGGRAVARGDRRACARSAPARARGLALPARRPSRAAASGSRRCRACGRWRCICASASCRSPFRDGDRDHARSGGPPTTSPSPRSAARPTRCGGSRGRDSTCRRGSSSRPARKRWARRPSAPMSRAPCGSSRPTAGCWPCGPPPSTRTAPDTPLPGSSRAT